ncbi:uncharacterized protein K02A2.6-like isoform X2 [Ostrinia furnacalis]|uniref:uncharacterized protein K02A2.6-like isoform X2 n=1 Tax=Ostrinia furnacalis TaxID=93504 RepID=UPI00103B1492|nr:uncharacterized protein K02A2.6-like isoform X2 [Ostrinia furnacalis]
MLASGVIEPVEHSDWATPLVIVHKPDGSLRLCADFKTTLNRVLLVDKYPVPKIEDLFTLLNGSQYFTKIDLSQAYNQVLLDDSKENDCTGLTVINTHKGLFKYKRLVYGLASSPGIFQRIMTNLFRELPNVTVFLDDILISNTTRIDHEKSIEKVFKILKENGLKIKKQKCEFFSHQVKYLGYVIDRDGVRVDPSKLEPIIQMTAPTTVSELKSFLGMVNFYGKFIKNLSVYLAPLFDLLKKNNRWSWGSTEQRVFEKVKGLLKSAGVLAHYDASRAAVLTCDAGPRGLGAVLAQRAADGRERVVAYASRALTPAELNYSQIHKEALAIVFAVKKFHQYLYGRKFTLRTDHKPLVSIFGPNLGIPNMTASRLQRWAIILSAYDFSIEYIKSEENTADALSRLIAAHKESRDSSGDRDIEQTYLHFATEALLLSNETIKKETQKDPLLGRIISYIQDGWPADVDIKELKPYFNRKSELYLEMGCIMWGHRLVIPNVCRDKVLRELHDTHTGIVKMKSLARSYVWWPGLDEAIERQCGACGVCAALSGAPPAHAPRSWPWPTRPWSRIHIDFLGPIAGMKFLVIIDATSKWIECFKMDHTTASKVIERLRDTFARFGLPKQIVSDNGPPFSSSEFSQFCNNNGIDHIFTAPYHPSSNGAAENAVKVCKRVIKKAIMTRMDVDTALYRFLLIYRNTSHNTTGDSPAKLLLGRNLRTRLDCLKPDREKRIGKLQEKQENSAGGVSREVKVGEEVWFKNYNDDVQWKKGKVIEKLGDTDYRISLKDGQCIHRHIDQLKICKGFGGSAQDDKVTQSKEQRNPGWLWLPGAGPAECSAAGPGSAAPAPRPPAPQLAPRRYPLRERHPPTRYGFE